MKTRKKLVMSIFILIMTIILATGTTFAWITMNNRATVDGFDINIGSKSNALNISVDGKNYYNTLSRDSLMSAMGLSYDKNNDKICVAKFLAFDITDDTEYVTEAERDSDENIHTGFDGEGIYNVKKSSTDLKVTTTTYTKIIKKDYINSSYFYMTKGQAEDKYTENSENSYWFNGDTKIDSKDSLVSGYYIETTKNGKSWFQVVTVENGAEWSMQQVTYISKTEYNNGKNSFTGVNKVGYYTLQQEEELPNTIYKEVKNNNETEGRYLSVKLYLRSNASIAQDVYMYGDSNSSIVTPKKSEVDAKKAAVVFGKNLIEAGLSGQSLNDKYGSLAVTNFIKTNGSVSTVYSRAAYATRIGFFVDGEETKIFDPYKGGDDNPSFYLGNLARDISAAHYNSTLTGADDLYSDPTSDSINVNTSEETINREDRLFTLEYNTKTGFYEKEVTVTIWLEGRDGDCFSGVVEDNFSVNLSFVALPKGTKQ